MTGVDGQKSKISCPYRELIRNTYFVQRVTDSVYRLSCRDFQTKMGGKYSISFIWIGARVWAGFSRSFQLLQMQIWIFWCGSHQFFPFMYPVKSGEYVSTNAKVAKQDKNLSPQVPTGFRAWGYCSSLFEEKAVFDGCICETLLCKCLIRLCSAHGKPAVCCRLQSRCISLPSVDTVDIVATTLVLTIVL
jgi:hypothetical protein